ncbi:type I-C CRISPR-associated protein Cas8c/Csd1 [Streptomyces sp. TRM 70351]|uniref:type I-C CRISPR-associated protein Cas8c/Csd1 n=1 Tax=Streptomyces sp. TRM 70351 TaxID=3116552 RepID=UPI002E7C383C|nr:type I-C CRISPR-associated protein Cas8c/Csd1 [Streptomyces sp. TRM 70351]MEE1928311.1 type I-C CRISPR-associated protein Cas8c/Csd1 [Streptomyces sp. TRM 70351]
MLVQRLNEYADRVADELPAEFYRAKKVHWVLDIAEDGASAVLLDRRTSSRQRGEALVEQVPYVQRSGTKVPPYLLVDSAEFVLGVPKADQAGHISDKARTEAARRHAAYRELALTWAEAEEEDPAAGALRRFLADGITNLRLPETLEAKETVALMVGSRWLHTTPSVQRLWGDVVRQRKGGGEERKGQCLSCGEHAGLLDTIPEPVKKGAIPTAGGSNEGQLISVNTAAQGRGGVTQLANTPICYRCGGRMMAALNHLVASSTHCRRFRDDGVLLWWTREATDESVLAMFFDDQPDPADIAHLIDSLHTEPSPHTSARVDSDHFYGLSLGLNNARLVVREWIDTPLPTIKTCIGAWYADHGVYDGWNDRTRYVPLWQMALSCGRWTGERYASDSAPRGLESELLRSALRGDPPPARTLPLVLQRIHADRRIDAPRIALLRLILNRSADEENHVMPTLDPHSTDPAYLSGRLFAVLEEIQREALPDLNTTLRDKHFSTAVTAPNATLRHLRVNANAHLKRLRRDNRGAGVSLEKRITEIYAKLHDDLPLHLTPIEQGRFITGYEHQRAEHFAAAREGAEARKAKKASQEGTPETPPEPAA